MKKIILVTFISLFAAQANAGLWDSITSWFSSDEEKVSEPAKEAPPEPANALVEQGLQLLPYLVQQLGVSEGQASGGLGSLIQAATALLSEGDGKSLLAAIPNAASLLGAAPQIAQSKGENNMLSDAINTAGEYSEKAKVAAQLHSQFESLGLGADMIPKFAKTTETYLGKNDNADAGKLLNSALSSLL